MLMLKRQISIEAAHNFEAKKSNFNRIGLKMDLVNNLTSFYFSTIGSRVFNFLEKSRRSLNFLLKPHISRDQNVYFDQNRMKIREVKFERL